MDLNDPTRFRKRKPTLSSRERFLGVPSHAPRLQNPSSSATDDDDLIEDDVVFSNNDDSTEPSSSVPNHHKAFAFGILAALPENDHPSPNGSHFFHHKPSVSLSSSSSSSSSRLIPVIPKPPPDRIPSSSVKFHQSAPVNVPVLPTRWRREFDEDDGDAAAEEEMLPPHEIVERNSEQSPMLACSVLEGVGRTLKGRDLRQVRNAVWRQTGFLD
ncbi:Senescence regulator S40 [Spatholobus suberectus]|nr:Senescence regulator S40 [Spatholobus suberectus]